MIVGALSVVVLVSHQGVQNCVQNTSLPCCAEDSAPLKRRECTALKNFFVSSSEGDKWIYHPNWLLGGSYCGFYGVSCNTAGHVTKLILPGNGLQGIIHSSIFEDLIFLEEFNVANNQLLAGPIPREIGSLEKRSSARLLVEIRNCEINT